MVEFRGMVFPKFVAARLCLVPPIMPSYGVGGLALFPGIVFVSILAHKL